MKLTIQQRFIFLSVLPLTVIALALSAFFVHIQLGHIEDSLTHRGQSMARHLASASAYGVSTNNIELLKPVAESMLEDPEVQSIVIVNNEGAVLFRSYASTIEPDMQLKPQVMHKDNLIFMKPIYKNGTQNPQSSNKNPNPVTVGWSIVELSKNETQALQYLSLKESVLFIMLLLVLSFLLIYRISKSIASPIVRITDAANQIEQGNFDVQLETGTSSELINLEKSIKNMAASLKKSRHELQKEIDQATTNLINSIQIVEKKNKQLVAARQQAVMASRVKSEFLANMSHEIRTPMNGILGFIKLLRKTKLSSQQLEHIDTIEKSANNLMAIINDILDISKIESGKIRVQNEAYNLRECVEEILSLLAPAAYEKKLNLVSMIYSDVPLRLYGDASKLRQILTNLVSNAIKFTDEGNVVVRTMLENEYESKTKIKISVSDTGIGISPKDQNRLFNTFEQVDSSSTRKFGGTGLGLAISKSLAELMQGEIGLYSEPKNGSTFWFTFLHEPIKLDSSKPPGIQQGHPSLAGYNALLYDSNDATLLALTHLCDDWEIFFDTTSSIEDMAKKIKTAEHNAPYDFIVMGLSYEQAEITHFNQIYHRIRNLTQTHLVCLINSADTGVMSRFADLGVNAVLAKPVKSQELHFSLRSLLIPNSEIFDYQRLAQAEQQQSLADQQEQLEQELNSGNKLSGLNILVAEDNEINAKLVNSILLHQGASVTIASNGNEAVAACTAQTFDIVLMDIHMPETNGVEATKQIRAQQSEKSIPIVALTADALSEDQLAFLEAGMNDVLIKPVNEELLINKILYLTDKEPANAIAEELLPKSTRKTQPAGNHDNATITIKSNKDSKLADEILQMLIKELPAFKLAITESQQQQNFDSLYQHVHKLHGALSYCRLPEIKDLVQKIERDLKLKRYEDIDSDLDILFQNLDTLIHNAET
ncbi:response regulator [Kaarinaea lacus]